MRFIKNWIFFFIQYISLNVLFSTTFDYLAPDLMNYTREVIISLYFTGSVIVGSLIWGLIMFLSTIYTFKKRKLYLE